MTKYLNGTVDSTIEITTLKWLFTLVVKYAFSIVKHYTQLSDLLP